MLREFIQCKNTKERMALFATTNINNWTESNLNTVMEILGTDIPEGATKEDKWELIILSLKTKEAADIAALGQKLFHDTEDEVQKYTKEETDRLSDFAAYLKSFGENVA